ncbi:MAG: methionyl-tRNA formyltransferase [Candidatus Pacebacteria bacterium]|nr:methionyl-tRNA formyltransferase [Candidatus Paceibacterota bacterium]
MSTTKNLNLVFFGTSEFAVKILDKLIENGYVPSLVVTTPDKPQGRKMVLTPPPVKERITNYESRIKNQIKIIQPEKLNPSLFMIPDSEFSLFIVAAYGKIIPKSVLEIPKFGTLNVHPSLLPKFRGPSPIQSFILSGSALGGEKTGVTIMLMDELVDHGPILSISNLKSKNSNLNAKELEEKLAELGGQMLVDVISKWVKREIKAQEQDHAKATFTKKITKEDGLVDLEKNSPEIVYRKFLAFQPWPGIYYFTEKDGSKIRVIITDMELSETGELKIKKVKPEGRNEMSYEDFLKGNR